MVLSSDRRDRCNRTRSVTSVWPNRRLASAPIPLDRPGATVSSIPVSISAGLACMDSAAGDHFADAAEMLHLAEQALRAAKGAGRNTMRVYAPTAAAAA